MRPEDAPTIPALVAAAADAYGDARAIEEDELRLSFRQLHAESLRAARAFIAAGVEPSDRVGIWAPNVSEWILAAVGLQSAGAVLVTLNTRFKGAEAAYVLRKSRAKLLFTMGGEFLGTDYVKLLAGEELPDLQRTVSFRGEGPGAQTWQAFLAEGEGVPEEHARERAAAVKAEDLSDFIFTSGTTGAPKAVMTAHGQNIRTFKVWSGSVGLRQGDRYLIVNPFFHSFGYKAGWLAAFMRGATVLPHQVFDARAILGRIANEGISVLPGPPTVYQSLLGFADLGEHDISSLRLAVTGAAAIPVELVRQMREELGFETVLTAYGLTESCGVVTLCDQGDDAETIATTSGRAMPDIEVKCVDADGKEVARGEAGEIWVRGYNVMQGYFDDEEATREAVDAEGWLHTGDVAVMDGRGYVRITDRIKDMFITGGFNVYPAEVENLLYGSGLFAQVAVVGVPDLRMGEVCMAFVVPAAGQEVTPESVISWSRDNMANYKAPRHVEVVSELPANASGKVLKFELRKRAEALVGR